MNTNLSKQIGDLETNLTREIRAASRNADAAYHIATKTQSELDELRVEVAELKQWCGRLQLEATSVKSQANSMETYSRSDNIIIYGIISLQINHLHYVRKQYGNSSRIS